MQDPGAHNLNTGQSRRTKESNESEYEMFPPLGNERLEEAEIPPCRQTETRVSGTIGTAVDKREWRSWLTGLAQKGDGGQEEKPYFDHCHVQSLTSVIEASCGFATAS